VSEWSRFALSRTDMERRPDGTMILRAADPLGEYERRIGDVLLRNARTIPDRLHLAQRGKDGAWRKLTYADSARVARAVGQALLDRKLGPDRPVLIVAENGLDHAILNLGATLVGVPFVPVSAAYSRPGQGFSKLRHILGLIRPGLIFVDSWARYEGARVALDEAKAEIVIGDGIPAGAKVTPFSALTGTAPTQAVNAAAATVGPDTIAKVLFTSGSTDVPKGVINNHRMICSNQKQIAHGWPFLRQTPPVQLDWLPWSHTFAGNYDFYLALWHGGAYYIDEGKPAPGLIEKTMANLREVSPTMYLNVPRGYALMLPFLEKDKALRDSFFANLAFVFFAGAAMDEKLQQRVRDLARQSTGKPVPLICAWGATETAPLATTRYFPTEYPSNIGVPVPGCEIKLAPVADKLEIRVRGPNVTPGYWQQPDASANAFDDEGFYPSGDAVKLCDPNDPSKGLLFDGRITENFKLSSGTWVHVGMLRLALIAAAAPVIEDCVITGQDRDEAGALVFPSLGGCRSLCPHLPSDAPAKTLIAEPVVRQALAAGLRRLAASGGGSSMRVDRALFVAEPPSVDAGEITDKGYLNQRAVLASRAALVERLYAERPDADIVRLEKETAS
jgi:feruloyl-CoA synthase